MIFVWFISVINIVFIIFERKMKNKKQSISE